jgi:hypothetical protein
MSKLSPFDYYVIKEYCNKYKIKNANLKENIHYFRYSCMKMNYFMKNIILPRIKKESLYESVFIEFRNFPHIEFNIRNAILKLGTKWAHTVICGNANYNMVEQICTNISPYIKIIKLDVDNMTQSDYSLFLMQKEFWNMLKGEKIFIHQEDSLVFKNNIDDFIDYDYIGAPFLKTTDDTPNSVGNGGLSIRTKKIMLDIISKFPYQNCEFNRSTLIYMSNVKLKYPPEDVYFSKCMQENCIGSVADWDTAFQFSTESVYNRNSFAGHKFWVSSHKTWRNNLKDLFKFSVYTPKSDLNKYLTYLKKPEGLNKNKEFLNAFDVDLYFFCKINNLEYTKSANSLEYFKKIGLNGFIYHPKQLTNMFSHMSLYKFMSNIYITTELNAFPITIQDFANKYLYNSSFEFYTSLLIKQKYSCLNNNYNTLFLVFIGNEQLGIELLESISKHKKINPNFNISICFNSDKVMNSPKIKKIIKNNFDFYAIYKCKEMGTDITPTLLMYNEIIKSHSFLHIYKFHTKKIVKNYLELTDYLLSMNVKELLQERKNTCNCIGHPLYYMYLEEDEHNNRLKHQYNSKLDVNKEFVAGTIFYCEDVVFNKVLHFMKHNNYRSYLLNNLYENNSINYDLSPIHFLERVFGTIRL